MSPGNLTLTSGFEATLPTTARRVHAGASNRLTIEHAPPTRNTELPPTLRPRHTGSGPPMPHTLVTVHAHPDDEAIATSGTMARAKADGHRVVLVVATRGELGEVPDDLAPGETL